MDSDEATNYITEITVGASEKRQIESQYEPTTAEVTLTAEVPEEVDASELQEALSQEARDRAQQEIMRRIDQHIKKEAGIE